MWLHLPRCGPEMRSSARGADQRRIGLTGGRSAWSAASARLVAEECGQARSTTSENGPAGPAFQSYRCWVYASAAIRLGRKKLSTTQTTSSTSLLGHRVLLGLAV